MEVDARIRSLIRSLSNSTGNARAARCVEQLKSLSVLSGVPCGITTRPNKVDGWRVSE